MNPENKSDNMTTPEVSVTSPLKEPESIGRPNLPEIEQLASMLNDIADMEESISELKTRIRTIPSLLRARLDNLNDRLRVAHYLYWNVPDIGSKSIERDLLDGNKLLYPLMKSAITEIVCDICHKPIKFHSRTHLRRELELMRPGRYAEGYSILCRPCETQVLADRNKHYAESSSRIMARMRELESMSYKDYLQTPEWAEKRKQQLRSAGYRCQVCNSNGNSLNVHHRTYERRGNERYKDLIVLCQPCHELFHKKGRLAE